MNRRGPHPNANSRTVSDECAHEGGRGDFLNRPLTSFESAKKMERGKFFTAARRRLVRRRIAASPSSRFRSPHFPPPFFLRQPFKPGSFPASAARPRSRRGGSRASLPPPFFPPPSLRSSREGKKLIARFSPVPSPGVFRAPESSLLSLIVRSRVKKGGRFFSSPSDDGIIDRPAAIRPRKRGKGGGIFLKSGTRDNDDDNVPNARWRPGLPPASAGFFKFGSAFFLTPDGDAGVGVRRGGTFPATPPSGRRRGRRARTRENRPFRATGRPPGCEDVARRVRSPIDGGFRDGGRVATAFRPPPAHRSGEREAETMKGPLALYGRRSLPRLPPSAPADSGGGEGGERRDP